MKVVNKIDFRLVIEPENPPWRSENKERAEKQWQEECDDIKDMIRANIPSDNIKAIRIEYNEEHLCSFCNGDWEYEPCCCDAAIQEWEETEMEKDYL